jgi:hypothetical protein
MSLYDFILQAVPLHNQSFYTLLELQADQDSEIRNFPFNLHLRAQLYGVPTIGRYGLR